MYLDRLLTVLEAVSQSGIASVADIAAATGYPKPSVYRHVNDLVTTGLLEPIEKGSYVIGTRLKRVAGSRFADDSIKQLAIPLLKQSAQEHGATFFISRLRQSSVDIIHAEVPNTGISYLHPGLGARPIHACSCSKAVAAFSDEPMLSRALSGRLKAYTEHTKTEFGDLKAEFAEIRVRGYAECIEEMELGVCSVAAPVLQAGHGTEFSLGATATTRVLTETKRVELGASLKHLCATLASLIEMSQNEVADQISATG